MNNDSSGGGVIGNTEGRQPSDVGPIPTPRTSRPRVEPCELREAKEFITRFHRHHRPPQGHRFSLKVVDGETGETLGVVCVGRPVARYQQDGYTVEITRLCVKDGQPNLCSFLVGKVKRICREMGFRRVISYTLESEPGTAWVAAGMVQTGKTTGGAWSGTYGDGKRRANDHPLTTKRRWEVNL